MGKLRPKTYEDGISCALKFWNFEASHSPGQDPDEHDIISYTNVETSILQFSQNSSLCSIPVDTINITKPNPQPNRVPYINTPH